MSIFKHIGFWTGVVVVALIAATFLVWKTHMLSVAHSTFENYYAFRGCIELISKTETSAQCRIKDGNIITLVQINNKWYLQGDGPGIW